MTTKAQQHKISASLRKKASTNSNKIHVIPSDGKWAVKKEGEKTALKLYSTKKSALLNAEKFVNDGLALSVIVHRKNGSVILQ